MFNKYYNEFENLHNGVSFLRIYIIILQKKTNVPMYHFPLTPTIMNKSYSNSSNPLFREHKKNP